MRTSIVIFATLAGTATIAAAEPPGLVEAVDAPTPPSKTFVGVETLAGFDFGVDAQLAIEGGYRLDDVWSLHGLVATGLAADDQGGGAIHQVRAGVEAKTCTTHRLACVYGGIDAGYQAYTWRPDPWQEMTADEPHHDMIAVLRAGFDVGGRHLRVRPGIETYSAIAGGGTGGTSGLLGMNLDLGVAYQW